MKLVLTALLSLFAFFVFWMSPMTLRAQAGSTASKSAEISAFAGYMPLITDYGPHSLKGIDAGADFTVFPRFPVAPSFEIRGTDGVGLDASERTLSFGLRVQRDIRERFHPYADVLIGVGEIVFHPLPAPDYTSDKSRVLTFGGGINIDITRSFALKIDAQGQSWNFGSSYVQVAPSGDFTLTPILGTVGVTYTIPFRILNHRSDFR